MQPSCKKHPRKAKSARREITDGVDRIMLCAKSGNHQEISAIIRKRMAGLNATPSERLCENTAVNALVTHYAAIAHEEGIEISYKLDIREC